MYFSLQTQYPVLINGQLGDGFVDLAGPIIHLGLIVDMMQRATGG